MCDNCGARVPRPIERAELDAINRVVVARCQAKVAHVLNEYRGREMGNPAGQGLIGQIQDSLHDELAMLIPKPEVRQSGK
jgi:hypothetical protein